MFPLPAPETSRVKSVAEADFIIHFKSVSVLDEGVAVITGVEEKSTAKSINSVTRYGDVVDAVTFDLPN